MAFRSYWIELPEPGQAVKLLEAGPGDVEMWVDWDTLNQPAVYIGGEHLAASATQGFRLTQEMLATKVSPGDQVWAYRNGSTGSYWVGVLVRSR